jgi:hypothetical protein
LLWSFVIIVVLTGLLLIPNALYAFRRFLVERNLVWLVVYLILLTSLGYLLLHVTRRTVELVQTAKEELNRPDL